MSLTSYRAAPPRGEGDRIFGGAPSGSGISWPIPSAREGGFNAIDPDGWFGLGVSSRRRSWRCRETFHRDEKDREQLWDALGRPGSDLLSRVLRRSTIGAEGFHGRVRNGIGLGPLARTTRPAKRIRELVNVGGFEF